MSELENTPDTARKVDPDPTTWVPPIDESLPAGPRPLGGEQCPEPTWHDANFPECDNVDCGEHIHYALSPSGTVSHTEEPTWHEKNHPECDGENSTANGKLTCGFNVHIDEEGYISAKDLEDLPVPQSVQAYAFSNQIMPTSERPSQNRQRFWSNEENGYNSPLPEEQRISEFQVRAILTSLENIAALTLRTGGQQNTLHASGITTAVNHMKNGLGLED